MNSDIQWFLGVIVIIGVLTYMGWSTRKGGSFFSPATSTVAAQYDTGTAPESPVPKTKELEVAEQIQKAQNEVTKLQEEIKQAKADADASPLRGKLSVSSASRGNKASNEYVVIRASDSNTAPVSITGLTLRGVVSRLSAAIPKAWRLPYPGTPSGSGTITLAPGEFAYIITGRSPNNMSFLINKCTGFFAQSAEFNPSLPNECPSPAQEALQSNAAELSEDCLDYLASFPGCTNPPDALPEHLKNDGSCHAYVFNKISYNRCVALHKNEPDFYRGDWRVYLERDTLLWGTKRETIELVDANGKLIGAYNY